VELLEDSELAARIAGRARREVEMNWDTAAITRKLVEKYGEIVRRKRAG